METTTAVKLIALRQGLAELDSVLVAYSGGVDSAFLTKVAADVLGPGKVTAVTATSATYPPEELETAARLARHLGVTHLAVEVSELDSPEFVRNTPDRCYYCKRLRYAAFKKLQAGLGARWLVDGTNADDARDYRPGLKAAGELGVRSPLLEAELDKAEIRELSRELGIPGWNRPSQACLASRLPYGTPVTEEKLRAVLEAERFLQGLGFPAVRVRHHGDVALIEVPAADFSRLIGHAPEIRQCLREQGFTYAALDLAGYRSGSLNEGLGRRQA